MQKDAGFGPFGLWPWIWAPCCSATIREKERIFLQMVQLRHGYPDLPEFHARSFGQVYKVCADVDGTRRCFLSPISDQNIIKSTAVLSAFHCSDVFSVWLLDDVAWQFQLCLWQIPAGFPVKSVKLNLAVNVCTKKDLCVFVLRFNSKDRWSDFYTSCRTPRHQQCCILFGFEW